MNPKKLVPYLWAGYLLFVLYWISRFWGHFPAFMDTLEYVFPEKWFNVESFQKGLIPLWDPYLACGTPHVANLQSAFFYPFFWFWNFTGLTDWFFVVGLAHGVLASVGFFFWLRALKIPSLVSTLCALSFGGSAYVILYWGFPTHLASMAWVPWIFWAAFRLSQKFSRGRWAILSLFWAFQILAGYPFFCFYTFLFLIFCLKFEWNVGLKNKLIQLSAFLAALTLTACQWMPFVDLLGYMHREVWGGDLFSLNWINFRTLLLPDGLGIPGTQNYLGTYATFIFSNWYLGLIPLGFLVWAFIARSTAGEYWRKTLIFWLFWPMGTHFILWRILPASWLDKLEPSKASFLFLFCALTALGLFLRDTIRSAHKKNFINRYAWLWIGLWVLDLVFIPFRMVQVVPDPYRDKEVQRFAAKVHQTVGEGRIISKQDAHRRYSSAVKDFAGSMRETSEDMIANTNVVWGIKSAQGYLTTVVDGYQNFTKYLQDGYPYDGRVLDAAGVNTILMPRKIPIFKYRSHVPLGHLTLIHNPGAVNFGWEVGRAREVNSRPEAFAALMNPKVFLENEVFLERGLSGVDLLRSSDRSLGEMDETSFWRSLRSGELFRNPSVAYEARISPCESRWDMTATRAGFFVFDETFAPGWRAWVDGQPKHIRRANGMWMAVPLSRTGSHQIVFRYQPLSFRLGLFVTLLALAAFIAALIIRPMKSLRTS